MCSWTWPEASDTAALICTFLGELAYGCNDGAGMSGPTLFAILLLIGSLERIVIEIESEVDEIGIMLDRSVVAYGGACKISYRSSINMLTCNHSAVPTISVSFCFLAESHSIRNNAILPAKVWHACRCSA
jgi:hypothetical protein